MKDTDDHESWMEFYSIYSRIIYSLARHRGLSNEEAQEVVIETIAAAARHMPGFNYDRRLGSFRSWLLQMARWRIADQYKKRPRYIVEHNQGGSKVKGAADTDLPAAPATTDLERMWDEEWERCILDKATERAKRSLNPKLYQVYDLCVRKEWSAEKVAQFISMQPSQVYRAKYRVFAAIKKEVERLREEII